MNKLQSGKGSGQLPWAGLLRTLLRNEAGPIVARWLLDAELRH